MTRIRRARPLLLELAASSWIVLHYVTHRSLRVDELALALLRALEDWTEPEPLFAAFSPPESVAAELLRLLDHGIVVSEGSAAAGEDERFGQAWEWGSAAGAFHFGIRNTVYLDAARSAEFLLARAASRERVQLFAESSAGSASL